MDELLIVAALFVALAFWQRSTFMQIIAGTVAVGFGIYWLTAGATFIYVMEGVGSIAIGLYMLIDVAIDLFKDR